MRFTPNNEEMASLIRKATCINGPGSPVMMFQASSAVISVGSGAERVSFAASVVGVMLLAVGAVLCGVVTAALLSETFPTRTRYTASAITYNMAYTIFGGTAPLVATWLISTTGSNLSPAFYLIAVAVLALAGGLALPETSRISLHEVGVEEKGAAPVLSR